MLQRYVPCKIDVGIMSKPRHTTDTKTDCPVLFMASLEAWGGKKISEIGNHSGKQCLITREPRMRHDTLWYPMQNSTIRRLLVTPTDSQAEQYSTCCDHSWAKPGLMLLCLLGSLLKEGTGKRLLWGKYFCATGVTESRGATAKLVMLAELGRWQGCCHYMLPCNFPTGCFFDKNRKRPNC